jgi:hypothetical protein
MITELEVLTQAECASIRDTIHALKMHWIRRNPIVPFHTLAIASYLDAVDGTPYVQKAQFYNLILSENFQWLYRRLTEVLESFLGAPVVYHDRFALPGFHILGYHETCKREGASIHCDLQYTLLDWEDEIAIEQPTSFTLSIVLPPSGGGLWTWDLYRNETKDLPPAEFTKLINTRNKTYNPYKIGNMVVHSGHQIHQIAAMPQMQEGDERITFQGHGIPLKGVWQLYW